MPILVARYRRSVKMLNHASLTLTPDGLIIRVDNGILEMLGYVSGDLVGQSVDLVLTAAEAVDLKETIERSKSTGAVHGLKTGLVRKDGSSLTSYISFYPMQDRQGRVYSVVLTFDSVPGVATPPLFSNEFQRMFRFSNDAVAVTDTRGCILDVNQAFLDTYGYSRGELLGANPRILKSHHSSRELYSSMWADILDQAIGYWRGEIINLRKDGTEVPALLTISAIKDESGEVVNFLGVALDMTVEKELERLRKIYIDYIVHDMRGPLTTIMLNSDLLQMQIEAMSPEKARKKIDVIKHSSQRLSHMTADILDYSRLQRGANLPLDRKSVLFSQILREAAMPFEAVGKRFVVNGVDYADYIFDDAEIFVDIEKLNRVLYNLICNAFKYASTLVEVRFVIDDKGLAVTVEDDGRGISRKDAERIFEAFYQGEDGIRSGSAGLGLSVVKSFVEAHGGRVWSEPGKDTGARFSFHIPYVKP